MALVWYARLEGSEFRTVSQWVTKVGLEQLKEGFVVNKFHKMVTPAPRPLHVYEFVTKVKQCKSLSIPIQIFWFCCSSMPPTVYPIPSPTARSKVFCFIFSKNISWGGTQLYKTTQSISCCGGRSSFGLVWALSQAPVDIETGRSDVFWPTKSVEALHGFKSTSKCTAWKTLRRPGRLPPQRCQRGGQTPQGGSVIQKPPSPTHTP